MATCTTPADCDAHLASYERRIAFFREMEANVKSRPPTLDLETRLRSIRQSIESIQEAADRMRAYRSSLCRSAPARAEGPGRAV